MSRGLGGGFGHLNDPEEMEDKVIAGLVGEAVLASQLSPIACRVRIADDPRLELQPPRHAISDPGWF